MKLLSDIKAFFNKHEFVEEDDVLIVNKKGKEFRCVKCGLANYTSDMNAHAEIFNSRGCRGSIADHKESLDETFRWTNSNKFYHFLNTTNAVFIADRHEMNDFYAGLRSHLGKYAKEVHFPKVYLQRHHFPNILTFNNGKVKFFPTRKKDVPDILFRDIENNLFFQIPDKSDITPKREDFYFYVIDRKWNMYIVENYYVDSFPIDIGCLIREKVLSAGFFSCVDGGNMNFRRYLIKLKNHTDFSLITPVQSNPTFLKRFRVAISNNQFKIVCAKFIKEEFVDERF